MLFKKKDKEGQNEWKQIRLIKLKILRIKKYLVEF